MPRRNLRQKLAKTGEKRASKSTFTRRQSNYLIRLRAVRHSLFGGVLSTILTGIFVGLFFGRSFYAASGLPAVFKGIAAMAVFGYWIGFYAAVGGILGTLSNLSDGLCIAGSREARRKKKYLPPYTYRLLRVKLLLTKR